MQDPAPSDLSLTCKEADRDRPSFEPDAAADSDRPQPLAGGLTMRIFAASFITRESAVQALEALDRRFRARSSIRIAPLGHTGGAVGPSMVLAGRFEEDVIEGVRVAVAELGGTVLVDAEERVGP